MAIKSFNWDPLTENVSFETDENSVVQTTYQNEPVLFGEPESLTQSSETFTFHFDGEYSTRQLSRVDQVVSDTYDFSAYGEEVAKTGTTENPFQYKGASGYYNDPRSDEIYVRARSYMPEFGRWNSTDPKGFVDGPNLYRAYFIPNGTDPSGMTVCQCKCSAYNSSAYGGTAYNYRHFLVIDSSTTNCNSACSALDFKGAYSGKSCTGAVYANWTTDQATALAFCAKMKPSTTCPCCNPLNCEKDMIRIIEAARKTWALRTWINHCRRWVRSCEKRIDDLEGLRCVRAVFSRWNDKTDFGGATTGHMVLRITFCDSTVVYADNGTIGGKDRIFFTKEYNKYFGLNLELPKQSDE